MEAKQEIDILKEAYRKQKDLAFKDYFTFLKFQSISSEPAFKEQVLACADFVKNYLSAIGFKTELWETSGHPVVFATNDKAGPNQPTLLIYNHYDVQPVDPLDLWETPPFEPAIRNGEVFARGAQDNKGQCFTVLFALKTLIETYGSLPINIKLCVEGEEECGSAGLSRILQEKKDELQADYLAIVDLGFSKAESPSVTLGIRGLVAMDVEVSGSFTDLHSGSHGGLAFNPIHALVALLANARSDSGEVTIDGFYDDILPLKNDEKQELDLEFDEKEYVKTFGIQATGGETKYPPLERNWLRPSLEVNGIIGGYTGDGVKTVIPAKASAKVTCRLVHNQDPQKVGRLVAAYFEDNAPKGICVKVHLHEGGGRAVKTESCSKGVKAFKEAYEEVFDAPCRAIYSGASIPIVTELKDASGAETVMVGLGLPDDNIHAPNEHFGLDRIEKGVLSIARALQRLKE